MRSLTVGLQIKQLPPVIRDNVEDFLDAHPRSPVAQLRPRLGMFGNVWLAYTGPKLRRGASGLGNMPRDAFDDFHCRFTEPLISRNGCEAE